jgi:hypothetical protein
MQGREANIYRGNLRVRVSLVGLLGWNGLGPKLYWAALNYFRNKNAHAGFVGTQNRAD